MNEQTNDTLQDQILKILFAEAALNLDVVIICIIFFDSMIILGLENCEGCKKLRDRHPGISYVEIPFGNNGNKEIIEIKKRIYNLGINRFPSLVNDDFSQSIPVSVIDPDF